ncbi:uncharacterized protein A1O9_13109 [Exophiala aquamarina CBS 119918]|uniref:Uncharacterized protein n=1 Tax=Exophiala aquamarina CBS 119918 TaxID=1182545 RepID=A0A072NUY6_9EURO|nr:uncharacterized protein A1O9_13109 [Exophiala aquamarina CBS 119918]KEF50838.1 hypothetical protein A1O9_13109 [Exophiala aquamarina CBS 119918]
MASAADGEDDWTMVVANTGGTGTQDISEDDKSVREHDSTFRVASQTEEISSKDESTIGSGKRDHDISICLDASKVIEPKCEENDPVVRSDTDQRLRSNANPVPSETGFLIKESNRDAIPLTEPNDATTGDEPERQVKRINFARITLQSDHMSVPAANKPDGIRKSLTQAIKREDEEEVILLLKNGANANSTDRWGCALIYAIKWQNETVVMELLRRGADANSTDRRGCALIYAIKWENETVVMELLRRGADANSTDGWGCALTDAQRYRLKETAKLLGQVTPSSSRPQVSRGSGQTTINGVFPAGTKLDISTPGGSRLIIMSEQPINASSVCAGAGSLQFIGDSNSLSALLRERHYGD